ncbi:MAG: ABC transporter ATP-binding protein [Bacilli bacterium]|nr:ABC transporter ATP-binding protein [Bacilli bacterium]
MDAIKTVNLSKSYNNTLVLKQLNLNVKKGEVYGFIGKNGAGKTTTINLILSLILKDSGQVFINEEEIKFSDLAFKKLIGYVPDVPVFPSYMCAKDYLRFTLDIFDLGDSMVNQKTEEILEFVSLPNSTKKISSYSRGMKQRLAIAQALIHDPEIIIMDEPTSALDPIGRNDVMNIIYKLRGSKTIFYSTHILDDVERVCDRIGLLDDGNLIVQDTVDNIQKNFFSNKFYIETKNEPKFVLKKIAKINQVQNAVKENHGIVCYLEENTDENTLLKKLMEMDENIVEFRRVKTSLEDVFIRLTNEKTT